MKILFPKPCGQRYYQAHFRHCLNLFAELRWDVEYFNDTTGERGCFKMFIDDIEFMIDFSDYGSEYSGPLPTLRFHAKRDEPNPLIFPFPQVSFPDWREYRELEPTIQYKAQGLVMNNQRSANTNVARRDKVRKIVEDWALRRWGKPQPPGAYPICVNSWDMPDLSGRSAAGAWLHGVDTQWHNNARKYWGTLNNCLVSIHAGGQNNNILDTAQLQLMGFGVCTISTYLPEVLIHDKLLVAGVHYIKCADDHSDLVDQIEWCRAHREECVQIGKQAKQLFQKTMTPQAAGAWLQEVMEKIKEKKC